MCRWRGGGNAGAEEETSPWVADVDTEVQCFFAKTHLYETSRHNFFSPVVFVYIRGTVFYFPQFCLYTVYSLFSIYTFIHFHFASELFYVSSLMVVSGFVTGSTWKALKIPGRLS